MNEKKTSDLRQTLIVLTGLAMLTAIEFGVASLEASAIALFVIAILKAGLIMNYFMQITGLWSGEDH